jgi:hypothetical protein
MIKRCLLFFTLVFFTFSSFAKGDIVQGPFKFDDTSYVYVKKQNDLNYPLSLYLMNNGVPKKIDSYEVNGDNPNIESIFFIQLDEIRNVIVLVSWHQEHRADDISGCSYQVYGYAYDGNTLSPNKKITDDPILSGEDGVFNGDQLHFKYKNAASIKSYLHTKYNK